MIGMILMIGCAIILSFSNDTTHVVIDPSLTVSSVWPVLFAILSSLAFGFRSIFIKYYVEKGYNVYNMAVQHTALDGIIGVIVLIVLAACGSLKGIEAAIFWKGLASGILGGIGTILINYAISTGVAGPASAMANLASVIQTIMDVSILG